MAANNWQDSARGEAGYSWLSMHGWHGWFGRLLLTLFVLALGIGVFLWYSRTSNDISPDSIAGYAYAVIGTLFAVMAGIAYGKRRRATKKRAIGQLNASLQWHMCLAVLALVFLCLHSFGNFNPRSGTYALYGMIALAISGFIGRFLDRLMPRLIAGEVSKALTAQGDDRIESISQRLQAIVVHNTAELRGFDSTNTPSANKSLVPVKSGAALPFADAGQSLQTPWDLAYISLEATPQELSRDGVQYRFVPDKKSELARPGALMPGAQEHISELQEVQQAMQREHFYRYVIRYWRRFHVLLALTTLGLTIWHLVYAAQLLIPVFLHK